MMMVLVGVLSLGSFCGAALSDKECEAARAAQGAFGEQL